MKYYKPLTFHREYKRFTKTISLIKYMLNFCNYKQISENNNVMITI